MTITLAVVRGYDRICRETNWVAVSIKLGRGSARKSCPVTASSHVCYGESLTFSCCAWQEIFLTYIAPCHYNAIRRRTNSLPRIFALSRSKSSIEAAMRQAERQGLPQDQVRVGLDPPCLEARYLQPDTMVDM